MLTADFASQAYGRLLESLSCITCVTIARAAILLLQNFGDIFFSLQVVISSNVWMVLPPAIRSGFNSLFNCLLRSTADSTVKKYLKEINKFFCGVEVGKLRYS